MHDMTKAELVRQNLLLRIENRDLRRELNALRQHPNGIFRQMWNKIATMVW